MRSTEEQQIKYFHQETRMQLDDHEIGPATISGQNEQLGSKEYMEYRGKNVQECLLMQYYDQYAYMQDYVDDQQEDYVKLSVTLYVLNFVCIVETWVTVQVIRGWIYNSRGRLVLIRRHIGRGVGRDRGTHWQVGNLSVIFYRRRKGNHMRVA